MKKALILMVLIVSLINAKTPTIKRTVPTVQFVLAFNPVFPGGPIFATTLADAEQEAREMSSLDPICFGIPQVCEARFDNTVYEIFYTDGTMKTIQ